MTVVLQWFSVSNLLQRKDDSVDNNYAKTVSDILNDAEDVEKRVFHCRRVNKLLNKNGRDQDLRLVSWKSFSSVAHGWVLVCVV